MRPQAVSLHEATVAERNRTTVAQELHEFKSLYLHNSEQPSFYHGVSTRLAHLNHLLMVEVGRL